MPDKKGDSDVNAGGIAHVRRCLICPCPIGHDLELSNVRGTAVEQGHLFHMACHLLGIEDLGVVTFAEAADMGTLLAYGMAMGMLAPELSRRILELCEHTVESEWQEAVEELVAWYEDPHA